MKKIIIFSTWCYFMVVSSLGFAQQTNVVGGSPATLENYPWQISLVRGGYHACGGTILSDEWILTAGHCLPTNFLVENVFIYAGSTNQVDRSQGQLIVANQVIRHFNYYNFTIPVYDIMLIKLATKLKFNDKVQPIPYANLCNSTDALTAAGVMATISGYGLTDPNATGINPNPIFLQVQIPAITTVLANQLNSSNPNFLPEIEVNDATMWAAHQQGQGAHQGDSGGPVTVIDNQTNKPILAGVTSWGVKPAAQYPSVQVKVRNFSDWIRQNTGLPYDYGWIKGNETFDFSATYSLENLPSGAGVKWTVSPASAATVVSPSSLTTQIVRNSNIEFTLTATYSTTCTSAYSVTKIIKSSSNGVAPIIKGNGAVCQQRTSLQKASLLGATNYEWALYNNSGVLIDSETNLGDYIVSDWLDVGTYTLKARGVFPTGALSLWATKLIAVVAYNGRTCGNLPLRVSPVVFPNPTSSELSIKISPNSEIPQQLLLFNFLGEKVADFSAVSLQFNADTFTFDVRQFPEGMYYLHIIYANGESERKQIIVQKLAN